MEEQEDLRRIGVAIRGEREKRGLNQKDAAAQIGISNTTLSKIESGDPVRPAILLRVLDTLGLEVRRGPQTSQSELLAPMVVAFIDKYGTDEERDEAAGYLLRMMGQYPGRRTSI